MTAERQRQGRDPLTDPFLLSLYSPGSYRRAADKARLGALLLKLGKRRRARRKRLKAAPQDTRAQADLARTEAEIRNAQKELAALSAAR